MKKILIIAIMILSALLLTACTGGDTPATTPKGDENINTPPNEGENIDPPHTHVFGEWTTVRESTCTENGLSERTCECGEKETKELDLIEHSYVATVVAPTCTETGYTANICACGKSYNTDKTKKLGHEFGEWYVATPSTCISEGVERSDCNRCDEFASRAISKLAHSYGEWKTVSSPTCVSNGERRRACITEGCNEYDAQTLLAIAGAHVMSEWETVKTASCSTEGEKKRSCQNPGCTEVETEKIPSFHEFGEWEITSTSTCKENGESRRYCKKCDFYESEELELAAHTYKLWSSASLVEEISICEVCSNLKKRNKILGCSYANVVAEYTIKNPNYEDSSTTLPYRRQGGCIDGGNVYQLLITKNEETACILKLNIATKEVTYSKYRPMGHGNDMTYDADTNCVYVLNGSTLYVYDADTLEYKGTKTLKGKASGISYNAHNDTFVALKSGVISIYDTAGNKIDGGFELTEKGETSQGICTDEEYIYVLYCTGLGGAKYHAYVYIYDYSGNFVNMVTVNIPLKHEPENISIVDGVVCIGTCTTQPYVTFYRVLA